MNGILIFAETDEGTLSLNFWESLAVGRQFAAQLGQKVRVAVQGWQIKTSDDARRSGAAEVYVVEDERLAEPWPDAHLAAFTPLCRELQPAMIILPRTLLGMEIAARLAQRLGVGVAQDALSLQATDAGLVATRPVSGGAVFATIRLNTKPWIVVPARRAFAPAEPLAAPQGELIKVRPALPADALKTQCGARVRQQDTGNNLERARVIIAGGYGLGGPEPFNLLREIAGMVNGAVGASRPVCDVGWVNPQWQIGLTGKTVAPEVYIAVGISGAIQHMAGCAAARVIVAINTDAQAPIFRMSTYGVVGDWKQVLPAFRQAIDNYRKEEK